MCGHTYLAWDLVSLAGLCGGWMIRLQIGHSPTTSIDDVLTLAGGWAGWATFSFQALRLIACILLHAHGHFGSNKESAFPLVPRRTDASLSV